MANSGEPMKAAFHISVALSLCALALTCKKPTEPPPPGEQPVSFSAIDASCTEVWLEVKFHVDAQPRTFEIRRVNGPGDTLLIQPATPPLVRLDTLIVDEGLLPNREYTYTLTRLGLPFTQQVTTTITTMDTTDHNAWVFDQPALLGDGSSSVLYDVAIINDSLAYAVGEIYKRDSLGNWDPNAYNIARWNGRQWQLARVYTGSTCNPINYAPLKAIWAFSDTNILVTSGGSLGWYNGRTNVPDCSIRPLVTGAINRIWASSPNNIYVVGNNGFIAHYNGTSWRRLESGTGLSVYDVFGSLNFVSGETEVYAVAAQQFVSFEKRIMKVTPSAVSVVSDSGIPASIHGVWFKGGGPYYVVGSGMYRKLDAEREGLWQPLHNGVTPYYIYAVRGNGVNDIFACGSFGELLHFSGASWHSYRSTPGFSSIEFYEVACRGSLIVAVGYDQPRAAVVIGRRP